MTYSQRQPTLLLHSDGEGEACEYGVGYLTRITNSLISAIADFGDDRKSNP